MVLGWSDHWPKPILEMDESELNDKGQSVKLGFQAGVSRKRGLDGKSLVFVDGAQVSPEALASGIHTCQSLAHWENDFPNLATPK